MIVAVLGAGGRVGSACAAALADLPEIEVLVLEDVDEPSVAVVRMDIAPVAAAHGIEVRLANDESLNAARLIVFCSSTQHRDGASRASFFAENAGIVDAQLDRLSPGWDGTLVMISNPVDALVFRAAQLLPVATVVGHALNDTLRFRFEIARELGLTSAASVNGFWLGAHGGNGVPIWSRVTVPGHRTVPDGARRAVETRIREWYAVWQGWRTGRTTAWSTAMGLRELAMCHLGVRAATLSLSVAADAWGYPGVCLCLPVHVSRNAFQLQTWRLPQAEHEGLAVDAAFIRELLLQPARLGHPRSTNDEPLKTRT